MTAASIYSKLKSSLHQIFGIGVKSEAPIYEQQRIAYFNTLIVALPVVYAMFIAYDFSGYLRPISEWYFDQYSFFIFSLICGFCLFLNHIGSVRISELLFVVSWPLLQHIIPIIIQHAPTDYYIAFPIGLIFHSLMIQMIFSSKYSPVKFWIFITVNFTMTIFFLEYLNYFDTEDAGELSDLANDHFYVLVVVMYWLLFNMVIFYIMRVVESHMMEIENNRQLVEDQKKDIQNALDELKASKDILVQSEKMASLGIFTTGIAHELNNSMNFIGSGTDILYAHLHDIQEIIKKKNPELSPKFEEIKRARSAIDIGVERSTKIIKSLKNYARPEEVKYKKCNLVACIHDALILIPTNLKNKVNIKEELPESLEILCNPNKMTQVFVNLIQNAIDASPDRSEVCIVVEQSSHGATATITDQGEGIKKKDRSRIFDPFYTTKKVGEGTGLGLYIVHDIIREHKGTISCTSVWKKGTTFKISLPRTKN